MLSSIIFRLMRKNRDEKAMTMFPYIVYYRQTNLTLSINQYSALMADLKSDFFAVVAKHGRGTENAAQLWQEIEQHHSHPSRAYHTLLHLKDIHEKIKHVLADLSDHDAIVLAITYHDIVYDVTRNDNEEQSAAIAEERLRFLPKKTMKACSKMIRATKDHWESGDMDTDHFTDADLSILGAPEDEYGEYAEKIRREYSIFSEKEYRIGRKKVLEH